MAEYVDPKRSGFKMKYTDGKKSSAKGFPFKSPAKAADTTLIQGAGYAMRGTLAQPDYTEFLEGMGEAVEGLTDLGLSVHGKEGYGKWKESTKDAVTGKGGTRREYRQWKKENPDTWEETLKEFPK